MRLCLSDEGFFITSSHLLTIWGIDESVYEVESQECSICFRLFSFFYELLSFLIGSFHKARKRSLCIDRYIDSMSSIKKLLIESISPPEESDTKLILTHANHESTDDKCFDTTIEDYDMSSFHRGDNLSFYTVEEICSLHK